MSLKQIGFVSASVGLVGLIAYGKYRLAVAKPVLWVLLLGGLVFAATTPAQAE